MLNDVILLWQPPLKQTFRRKDFTAKKDIFRSFSYFTFEEVILLKNVLTDKPLTPLGQKDFFKLRIKK